MRNSGRFEKPDEIGMRGRIVNMNEKAQLYHANKGTGLYQGNEFAAMRNFASNRNLIDESDFDQF